MSEALAELGLEMPKSNAAFKDLVDNSIKLGDLEIATSLIGLGPAFKSMQDSADKAKKAVEDLAKAEAKVAADKAKMFEDQVRAGRGEFNLDATKFNTSFEAKMAAVLNQKDPLSKDVLSAQNAIISQNEKMINLLTKISDGTEEANQTSNSALLQSTFSRV